VTARGSLHHVELQVRDLDAALASWGWILGELGYAEDASWADGRSLRLGDDRHPFAGGPDHRAAFLEDGERFKVELVADADA